MNLCDSCETVSHCTAHGCIPLTECINSGQVSAAQVVAHSENGEVMVTPYISQAQFDRTFPVAHQDAGELPEPFGFLLPTERSPAFHYMRRDDERGVSVFTADQMRAYAIAALAAKQEEVTRLRDALQNLWDASEGTSDAEISARLKARSALNPTQGATSHD